MPTNVVLDPDLVELAFELSGEKTKEAAVTRALREFVARRTQRQLLDLFNRLKWNSHYGYKADRSR